MKTTTLYRPVNSTELTLIEASNWRKFPPRLPEQPIFYPVTNIGYARQIAIEWNVPAYGNGFVTQFEVDSEFLKKYKIENVGNVQHNELWVPAEELDEFNAHIMGSIKVVESYQKQ